MGFKADILSQQVIIHLAGRVFVRLDEGFMMNLMEMQHIRKLSASMEYSIMERCSDHDMDEWYSLEDDRNNLTIGFVCFRDEVHWWIDSVAWMWMAPWIGQEDVTGYVGKILSTMVSSWNASVTGKGIPPPPSAQVSLFEKDTPIEEGEKKAIKSLFVEVQANLDMLEEVDESAKSLSFEKEKFSSAKNAERLLRRDKDLRDIVGEINRELKQEHDSVVHIELSFLVSRYGSNAKIGLKQIAKLIYSRTGVNIQNILTDALYEEGYIDYPDDPIYRPNHRLTERGYQLFEVTTAGKSPVKKTAMTQLSVLPNKESISAFNDILEGISSEAGFHVLFTYVIV